MVRGLIFGLIWGVIFMGIVLGVTSLMMPLPQRGGGVPPVTENATVAEPAVAPEINVEEPVEPTPQMSEPSVDPAPALDETTAAIMPEAETEANALTDVAETSDAAPVVSEVDLPTASDQPATMAEAPMSENDLAISTEPAQPLAPKDQELVFEEVVEPQPETMSDDAPAEMADDTTTVSEGSEESTTFAPDAAMEADTDVVVNRLPNVTSGGSLGEDAPLMMNSALFDNPEARPLMSIVLIDTGEFNIGPEALAAFPYPLTFAIDPLREDALDKAATYRAAGFELLALADLPVNAGAELADLVLVPNLDGVPGLIGALEGVDGGLQGNMALAEAVLDAVGNAGYGLLLRPKGLNAAQQMAEGRNLPVETIFRDFDDKGQDAAVIRRFLDQAAFKTRQEGEIVMVGRLRPATISALLLWGLQDRASSVALAPVSAILKN